MCHALYKVSNTHRHPMIQVLLSVLYVEKLSKSERIICSRVHYKKWWGQGWIVLADMLPALVAWRKVYGPLACQIKTQKQKQNLTEVAYKGK